MIRKQFKKALESESKVVNATCNQLLQSASLVNANLDFSLLIAGYFKIIEIEIRKKVFENFRESLSRGCRYSAVSFQDQYSRDIDSFVKFLKIEEDISLGEMLIVLKYLNDKTADLKGDVYSKLKAYLRQTYYRPHYFYGKPKLAERIQISLSKYRNPAIHKRCFTQDEFKIFQRIFFGSRNTLGLLNLTIKCLMPRAYLGQQL